MSFQKIMIFSGLCFFSLFVSSAEIRAETTPVVVELFESQGCSSCPPSERTLSQLRSEFGASVILLTFHVDYWDYLGWKDPYSDSRYTERQKMYGIAFRQDSIYTPEIVIQGEEGFNGANTELATREVRRHLQTGSTSLQVSARPQASGAAEITVRWPPDIAKAVREAVAVVYEDAAPVHVLRGENKGATMTGDSAVRTIALVPLPSASNKSKLVIPFQESWVASKVNVAILSRTDVSKIIASGHVAWPTKGL
jgi:hypothetical protein